MEMLEKQVGQSHQKGSQFSRCRIVGGLSGMPNVVRYLDYFGDMAVSWLEHLKTISSKPREA